MSIRVKKWLMMFVMASTACSIVVGQTAARPPATRSESGGGSASGGYASGGERGSVVQLMRDGNVRAELRLKPEQEIAITESLRRAQEVEDHFFRQVILESEERIARMQSGAARLPATQAARIAEAQERIRKRTELDEATRRQVLQIGVDIEKQLNPGQRQRLNEIRIQAQGPDAFFKAHVVERLGLTAAQQVRLATIRQETQRLPPPPLPSTGDLREAMLERAERMDRAYLDRLLAVLTPEQRQKLVQMRGAPFPGIMRIQTGGFASGGSGSSSDAAP